MIQSSRLAITALELRSAFDLTYATPLPSLEAEHAESLLAIRLAAEPYAIRVSEIAGLARNRKVVALPSAIPELLGLAGIRGEIVPIYSLAAFLGYKQEASLASWLALYGTQEPIGMAFSDFEGYVKVPSAEVYAANQNHRTREHTQGLVRADGVVRAIINLSSIEETLRRRSGVDRVSKEG